MILANIGYCHTFVWIDINRSQAACERPEAINTICWNDAEKSPYIVTVFRNDSK